MKHHFLKNPFCHLGARIWQQIYSMRCYVTLPVVLWVLLGSVQGAELDRIVVLQDSLVDLQNQRDSLQFQQVVLQTKTDSLAREVNALKQAHVGGAASGQLAQALRQSLLLTVKLEALYQEEIIVGQSIERIRSTFREACDAEIDRLIGALQTQPDSGTVVQLQALRALRKGLDVPNGQRVVPQVTVDADDTPDDIRLKAEFMADVALQLQNQKADVDRQLKRLVEEQRLRGRLMSFTNEFGLFDEALPQGRSVVAQAASETATGSVETSQDPNLGFVGLVPPSREDAKIEASVPDGVGATTVDIGREVTLEALSRSEGDPKDDLAGEIQRLRMRQEALILQEKQVQDRVTRLQAYLKQLLEGQTP
jgi:FtsZ-binding cell division protein ZapB